MSADEYVGQTGCAYTEISTTGRVVVGGKLFEATTSGPLIAAGEIVEITGWRLVDGSRQILSVHSLASEQQSTSTSSDGLVENLERLQSLRDSGALTAEEFAAAKAAILRPTPVIISQPVAAPQTGPKCYACSLNATTRCQRCGALSCASHLTSIYVHYNRGGAYELRCEECYESAVASNVLGWVIAIIAIIVFLIFASRHWR